MTLVRRHQRASTADAGPSRNARIGLIGDNGAGKSSSFRLISGLDPPSGSRGRTWLAGVAGRDRADVPEPRRPDHLSDRGRGVGSSASRRRGKRETRQSLRVLCAAPCLMLLAHAWVVNAWARAAASVRTADQEPASADGPLVVADPRSSLLRCSSTDRSISSLGLPSFERGSLPSLSVSARTSSSAPQTLAQPAAVSSWCASFSC